MELEMGMGIGISEDVSSSGSKQKPAIILYMNEQRKIQEKLKFNCSESVLLCYGIAGEEGEGRQALTDE